MPAPPSVNPTVHLTMSLDTFNSMQGILAKQPFEEISELIFFFRNQVAEQIQRAQQEQQQPPMPRGLHLAGEPENAVS